MTAASGEEAIVLVANAVLINLILMDIDLGKGIDGIEAARIIPKGQDIPVIFLSANDEQEVV